MSYKVMVTGNNGYIGPAVVWMLQDLDYDVVGLDTNFYKDCFQVKDELEPFPQIVRDIRKVRKADLKGIDAIIHLAGLSNDPLGSLNEKLTYDINHVATVRLAKLAKEVGVERFIFSSSQSMYGKSNPRYMMSEDSICGNEATAYGKSKILAEMDLRSFADDKFCVTCFRPSTVFGVAPNIRCDILLNNLVASAYALDRIEIHTDGHPWRPVVEVMDVAQAYIAGICAPEHLVNGESFNVGYKRFGNFTVRQLAELVQKTIKWEDILITYTGEHGSDYRTYRVSFDKIHKILGRYYKPRRNAVKKGIRELWEFFGEINMDKDKYRGNSCNRLKQIQYLKKNKYLTESLYWR